MENYTKTLNMNQNYQTYWNIKEKYLKTLIMTELHEWF